MNKSCLEIILIMDWWSREVTCHPFNFLFQPKSLCGTGIINVLLIDNAYILTSTFSLSLVPSQILWFMAATHQKNREATGNIYCGALLASALSSFSCGARQEFSLTSSINEYIEMPEEFGLVFFLLLYILFWLLNCGILLLLHGRLGVHERSRSFTSTKEEGGWQQNLIGSGVLSDKLEIPWNERDFFLD